MGFIDKTRQLIRSASTFFNAAPASMAASTSLQQQQLDVAIDQWRAQQLAEDPRLRDPRSLNRFEHRAFSQDGSDGILAEIFRRIGEGDRYFVEFGVGNGLENNTALLLSQGWKGLWIDGDREQVATARTTFAAELSSGQLTLLNEFITAENIEQLFQAAGVPGEPTLISIDIDGNDYWVWKAIEQYRPRVFELEYNAVYPPGARWVMEYNPTHVWGQNSYHGASLESLFELGREKGYTLVACSLGGINAYFVRDDLLDAEQFAGPFETAQFYHPARFFVVNQTSGHPRAWGAASGD